jgi:hypothetical protein
MFGHREESYRIPQNKNSRDLIFIESVCISSQSRNECEVTQDFSVEDQSENFRNQKIITAPDVPRKSVFVLPGTPLYHSIAQEIPEAFIAKNQENS